MSDPTNPRRPKPPSAAPGKPIPPPRKASAGGKPSGSPPTGKAVPPAGGTAKVRAVAAGEHVSLNVGHVGPSGGFHPARRRSPPAAAWIAVAVGVVAAGGLAFFLYDQQRKQGNETKTAVETPAVVAPEEPVDPPETEVKKSSRKEATSKEEEKLPDGADAKAQPKKEPAPRRTSKKKPSQDKSPSDKAEKKPAPTKKPTDIQSPPRVAVRESTFASARAAPSDETPAELAAMIEEALGLLDDSKFEEFESKAVYPARASDAEEEGQDDESGGLSPPTVKPTGKTLAGLPMDRLRLALKHIGAVEAKPHFPLEDRSVAVFVLSDKTQLHFLQVEKQWRLHRHHAVRFRRLSPQERLIGLLARETGKEAAKPTEEVVGEARMSVISQLEGMNAAVAATTDAEDQRFAVLLGPKYSGGLEGMKLFGQLGNLAMLVCESPPGFDDNMLTELDEMTQLHYLKLVGVASPLPITLHFREMTRLETLIVEGGLMEDIHMEHLSKMANLKRLTLFGRGLSDAALDRLHAVSSLRELTLEIQPAGAFSGEAVASLRRAIPNLWVDW